MIVICDLDGTLLKSDSTFLLLKAIGFPVIYRAPALAWSCLKKGKFEAKNDLARISGVNSLFESVNFSVLNYIKDCQRRGHRVILVSASNEDLVQQFGHHFGLIESFGSTQNAKLKGDGKLSFILDLIGNADFTYLGDSIHDFPIWQRATKAIVVHPNVLIRLLISYKFRKKDIRFIQ